MAMMASTKGGGMTKQPIPKRWKDGEISPERSKVWVEPPEKKIVQKKVAVVYYLTRNGQLQQPHFMEVPLSSFRGLFLKDVISRLNFLRGEGMAGLYSWSCKKAYGNGFVWQDLTENDFIYPTNGHEYVLKGSELHLLLEGPPDLNQDSETGSSTSSRSSEILDSGKEADSPAARCRRRNQSCSSIDLFEYKVYKTSTSGMSARHCNAADASTQTDKERRRRKGIVGEHGEEKEDVKKKIEDERTCEIQSVELCGGENSPPASDSSPETLQTLMKADKQLMLRTGVLNGNGQDRTTGNNSNSKVKASTVLMHLLSCGSFPFKDCGASAVKDHGLSLVSSYKSKLPRAEKHRSSTRVKLEEKEYFSGSLIQTKRESHADDELMKLKRSFSCNADRKSRLRLAEVEEVCKGTNNHR